jgi:endonuclease/exonuclease/phosphatase family metal-dependent hydrolase
VRIATFNIQHGRGADGLVDVDRLAETAAGLRADLLALEEVDVGLARSGRSNLAAAVARASGLEVVFGPAHRAGWRGRYGNALLAAGPISEVDVVRLPRIGRRERRSAIIATVDVAGARLSVAATHLAIHPEEAGRQLATVVEALAHRPEPRVLLGDLNLQPWDVAPRVRAAGLELADGLPTFPAVAPSIRIDHVALSSHVTIVSVEVPETPVSDHRPLVVTASLHLSKIAEPLQDSRNRGSVPFAPPR